MTITETKMRICIRIVVFEGDVAVRCHDSNFYSKEKRVEVTLRNGNTTTMIHERINEYMTKDNKLGLGLNFEPQEHGIS